MGDREPRARALVAPFIRPARRRRRAEAAIWRALFEGNPAYKRLDNGRPNIHASMQVTATYPKGVKTPFVAFEIPYEVRRDGKTETSMLRLVVTGPPTKPRNAAREAIPYVIETLRGTDALGVQIWRPVTDYGDRDTVLPPAGPLPEVFAYLLDSFLRSMHLPTPPQDARL